MTVAEFIAKWSKAELKERAAAQEHFLDLCKVFEHPTPAEADPAGEWFCFEKGTSKHGGGNGFADVWKRDFFGWEYKGKHKDLSAAYDQLLRYRDALASPPLLVLCDLDRIIVRTNFTGTVSALHEIPLEKLGESRNIEIMRAVFHQPEKLRPGRTSVAITQDAARQFADIAAILRERGHLPATVAHFLDRIVFCLFAEDTGLLPEKVFTRILDKSGGDMPRLSRVLGQLFDAMATGGDFGLESIRHFNGSLFDDPTVLDLTPDDVKRIRSAATLDWSAVDPSIFGTLFERGLDPAKRSQLGAHFTSREDIELVVDAVVMTPLRREWDETRTVIENLLTTGKKNPRKGDQPRTLTGPALKKARGQASSILHNFLVELQQVKVLDPACGSGNFLYVSLHRLKDLEKEVILFGSDNDLGAYLPLVGPWQLYGIEINPYAHDLAQMTVWIGWLQWIRFNGFGFPADPVLRPLADNIRCMDAILECGTGVSPVISSGHGQDAHATRTHGQDAHATQDPHAPHAVHVMGLDPDKPVDIRQGGYLPHWTQDGATYAVSFRLSDSLPAEVLRQWVLERDDIVMTAAKAGRDLSDAERQRLSELHSAKVEKWLDSGHGACWLKDDRIARVVRDALAHFDGDRYLLLAWCVMPNHVHAIIRPKEGCRLADIMHAWKSFTAKKANAILERRGEFWQAEYYDHLIRNEDDFRGQMNYVLTNPARVGLTGWQWIGSAHDVGECGTGECGTGECGTGECGTGVSPVISIDRQDAHATGDHGQDAHATQAAQAVEPAWPKVDFIVGNPPFLGGKMLRRELGDTYVDRLLGAWKGRVPAEADLCCYWFEKARAHIEAGLCKRAGLLATQGIRGGANRDVLKRIKESGDIFWAESDRPWILDGANVHVSMIAFDDGAETTRTLDGKPVSTLNANLTATVDIGAAQRLRRNAGIGFMGITPAGPFDLSSEMAESMLLLPNPNGRPNCDVLRPYFNGKDLNQRPRYQWTVDFGIGRDLSEVAFYEQPYTHVAENVRPIRTTNNREAYRNKWWLFAEAREGMRSAFNGLSRYLATCMVAKHRIYVWLPTVALPANVVIVFARSDDYFFGVLHSRFHEVWALTLGTRLETRPRYTPTTCFETFPFPAGTLDGACGSGEGGTGVPPVISSNHGQDAHATGIHGQDAHATDAHAAIAAAARELNELREGWLNPPEWTRTETLEFPGTVGGPWDRYIDAATVEDRGAFRVGTVRYSRTVPRDEACAAKLKKRTLTSLYNERPAWLAACHEKLDAAVAAAYGWPADLTDEAILERLLALNQEKSRAV